MRAILIDPQARTVTEVEHNGDYKQIYQLIDCDTFTVVGLDDVNSVYVDDEGLLNDPRYFFLWKGYGQPLANKGLILGTNEEGDSVSTTLSLDEVTKKVSFTELSVQGFEPLPKGLRTGPDHYMPNAPIVGHTPVFGPPEKEE